ncbi:hypothetical protein BDR03DRAFT_1018407 [Suillus americanus]|nr:hypothetical protein BDR03DRAFT_1018407 [Suillus americanus]
MDPPPVPPARGKGKRTKGGRDSAPPSSISWQSVPQRTNRLVDFLLQHPADFAILFSSEGKKAANCEAEGRTSGTGKNDIHSVLAGVVFSDDPHPPLSIIVNRKYDKEFPWYNQLYTIWGSHPAFAAKTSSLKPGVDHAGDLFSLTRPLGGSIGPTTSSSAGLYNIDHTSSAQGSEEDSLHGSPMRLESMPIPTRPQASSATGSSTGFAPHSAPEMGASSTQQWGFGYPGAAASPQYNFGPSAPGGSLSQWNYTPPPPSARTNSSAGSPGGSYAPSFGGAYTPTTQSFNSGPYSPAAPSFSNGFSYHGCNDDNPLAEEMEDLRMDGVNEDDTHGNTISLNSPLRPKTTGKGKKRQDPPSPSSPPSPPSPSPPATCAMPQKPCTSAQDDHSTFKSHAGQVMMQEKSKGGGSVASSRSCTLSACSKPTSSSQSSSPTAQTSLSTKPASAVSKRLRMEVREQVDLINNDLESMHSEKLSLYQLKNERLMVKLNASQQEKEHNLLREECANERADAAAVHQRFKEHKETEICLCEADTAALALEADVLCLRIEWEKLNNKPA